MTTTIKEIRCNNCGLKLIVRPNSNYSRCPACLNTSIVETFRKLKSFRGV